MRSSRSKLGIVRLELSKFPSMLTHGQRQRNKCLTHSIGDTKIEHITKLEQVAIPQIWKIAKSIRSFDTLNYICICIDSKIEMIENQSNH